MKNIYRISQTENYDYDTYDSAVVICDTEEEARNMHPNGQDMKWGESYSGWCLSPDDVVVELIGTSESKENRLVVASYNAG